MSSLSDTNKTTTNNRGEYADSGADESDEKNKTKDNNFKNPFLENDIDCLFFTKNDKIEEVQLVKDYSEKSPNLHKTQRLQRLKWVWKKIISEEMIELI
jgi:hypothetical protein